MVRTLHALEIGNQRLTEHDGLLSAVAKFVEVVQCPGSKPR